MYIKSLCDVKIKVYILKYDFLLFCVKLIFGDVIVFLLIVWVYCVILCFVMIVWIFIVIFLEKK